MQLLLTWNFVLQFAKFHCFSIAFWHIPVQAARCSGCAFTILGEPPGGLPSHQVLSTLRSHQHRTLKRSANEIRGLATIVSDKLPPCRCLRIKTPNRNAQMVPGRAISNALS